MSIIRNKKDFIANIADIIVYYVSIQKPGDRLPVDIENKLITPTETFWYVVKQRQQKLEGST